MVDGGAADPFNSNCNNLFHALPSGSGSDSYAL